MNALRQKALAIFSAVTILVSFNYAHAAGATDLMRLQKPTSPGTAVGEVSLGRPKWLPLNADGTYVKNSLNSEQQEALLSHFGAGDLNELEASQAKWGLEAVLHQKGTKFDTLSPANAADWLGQKQGHGAMFEMKVAEALKQPGVKIEFTRAGNQGTDLIVKSGPSGTITFVQAKATSSAVQSAQDALLDVMEFAGGEAARPWELASGKKAFHCVIPLDQEAELIQKGQLLKDGTPSPLLIKSVLKKASQIALSSGRNADRMQKVLSEGAGILKSSKVKAGPVTYVELVSDTKACAKTLQLVVAKQAARAGGESLAHTSLTTATPKQAKVGSKGSPATKVGEVEEGAGAIRETAKRVGKLSKMGKTMAGVGVVASTVQIYDGVQLLKDGEFVEGSVNLAEGIANGTSAIAALQGCAKISGPAMVIGAGIDGGRDLYEGITQDNREKLIVGSIKSGAAVTMGGGLATGQLEVVVPAAVVYGVAVVGDEVYENREAVKTGLNNAAWNIYDCTPESVKNNSLFQKSVGWFHGF